MNPRGRRQYLALLRKDLRLEFRTRETVVAMGLFSLVIIILFEFTDRASGSATRRRSPAGSSGRRLRSAPCWGSGGPGFPSGSSACSMRS